MVFDWLPLWQQYPIPGIIFGLSFLVSSLFTALFYLTAKQRLSLLPAVRERDVHHTPKPRLGGVAMWLAVMVTFAWILGNSGRPGLLNFGRELWLGIDSSLWALFSGMTVLLIMGLIDDIRGIPWSGQLAGQFLAVLFLVLGGVTVSYISLPSGYHLRLDGLTVTVFNQVIPVWSALFTMVWVMIMINVMNFFDGLDGLAGSVALLGSLALFFVSLKVGFIATATLSLVIAGAAAGFLPWNWYPSRIFMGTVGSQLLGFLLGVTAIISGGKVATAVLVLGIPVLDALIVVFRRIVSGVSPFHADQRHLHHRLLKLGLSVPVVVMIINGIAFIFAVLALGAQRSDQKGILTLVLVFCMAFVIAVTYALERRSLKK